MILNDEVELERENGNVCIDHVTSERRFRFRAAARMGRISKLTSATAIPNIWTAIYISNKANTNINVWF